MESKEKVGDRNGGLLAPLERLGGHVSNYDEKEKHLLMTTWIMSRITKALGITLKFF